MGPSVEHWEHWTNSVFRFFYFSEEHVLKEPYCWPELHAFSLLLVVFVADKICSSGFGILIAKIVYAVIIQRSCPGVKRNQVVVPGWRQGFVGTAGRWGACSFERICCRRRQAEEQSSFEGQRQQLEYWDRCTSFFRVFSIFFIIL